MRRIERGALIARVGADGERMVDDKRAIKIGVAAAAHQLRQHVKRRALACGRGGGGRHQIIAQELRLFDTRIGKGHGARRDRLRLLRANPPRRDRRLGRDLAKGLLREAADLLGIDVAGDHQRGVVRRIESLVERQRVFAVELLDLVVPADHRAAIGMIEIERRHDLLNKPRFRIIGDPHIVFFEHHVALGQHVLVLQDKTGHAVGLEFHHLAELFARHALVIAGVVSRGERVLIAAHVQHGLRELAGRVLAGTLEHQVFKEMGKARLAGRLVSRADLVPDHLCHHRRAMIGDHHHIESVGERERCRRRRGHRGLGKGARYEESEGRNQRGENGNSVTV